MKQFPKKNNFLLTLLISMVIIFGFQYNSSAQQLLNSNIPNTSPGKYVFKAAGSGTAGSSSATGLGCGGATSNYNGTSNGFYGGGGGGS